MGVIVENTLAGAVLVACIACALLAAFLMQRRRLRGASATPAQDEAEGFASDGSISQAPTYEVAAESAVAGSSDASHVNRICKTLQQL